MNPPQAAPTYRVTCETHDEAVLHCLNALAYFSESENDSPVGAGSAVSLTGMTPPVGWVREMGRVIFNFSDPRRRGTFLGEATRLLSGKWIRLDLGEG